MAEGDNEVQEKQQEKQWYVIHTYSGYENKVKANLEKRVESMGMRDKIFRVVVPIEEELEIKDGKKKLVEKKVFPGYVLVEMVMSDDSWHVVRNTPGVTGFVGSGNKPLPLQPQEVRIILRKMGIEEPRAKMEFEVGQSVRIILGPFAGFVGTVRETIPERGKLRLLVSMFGRDTPLEVDYSQVEEL
ncbi:MAG TPA: transcription termination/antitermination protein NusG [Firmicutes bacterium]|nr:transcription termination/antitermination protein NusG [Bacillota bacterium]